MSGSSNRRWGVIFDMDGVLVDSADAHRRSWQLLAAEQGRDLREDVFVATFGRTNDDIVPLLFGSVQGEVLRRLSARKEELYRDLIRARPPIVAGAVELVQALQAAGMVMAVGSSGPRANIDLVLSSMKVEAAIDVIVSADDVTRGKPDPQVFQIACARLGLHPSACVVVEDAPAGVQAAKAAGAKCAAVLMHHSRESLASADLVVPRLADLGANDLMSVLAP